MIMGKKNRLFKTSLQAILLILSFVLIAHGLWGPQFAPKNLTTTFVWVHYRGFLVLGILLLGNIFCMSCPFIFVRDGLRLFVSPKYLWPKKLRNKWTALFLFCAVLFCYEYFSLWSSPYRTALLMISFFAGALVVDLLFKKANFCKYLCPIGQFNFLSSTLSFKEVKSKNLSVCQSCSTQDCLRGNKTLNLRGCELYLLMPKKIGNLDCTFCMDCVAACPVDNIHVTSVLPGEELWKETHRSGIGKISERKDILALIIVFTFGSLLNAFAMIAPANILKQKIKDVIFLQSDLSILLLFFIFFLIVFPIALLGIPEILARKFGSQKYKLIPTLLPTGFAIWCAHYSFHMLSGLFTFIPLITKWPMPIHYMGLSPNLIMPIQQGILFLGLIGSIIVVHALEKNNKIRFTWSAVNTIITICALWILTMPMEMRGTFIGLGAMP